ncbi:MAG: hypothetical protein NC432_04010 [Roseburia sp.]|nr:hypothetical protein [Roseburia sp.]MCM1097216.1 hypothetical protein [Ruminococcus flavefaciens]
MKKIQNCAIVWFLLLVCSGIYGVVAGIDATNEYLYLTEDLRNQAEVSLTVGTLVLNYFSGAFRGIITIVCGFCGIAGIRKRAIKAWYFVFLGILTLLYVLGLMEYPYREEFVQMFIAASCFVMTGIYKFAIC